MSVPARQKLLAISSGGGHWIQLFRMRPAWDNLDVTYACTMYGLEDEIAQDAADRGGLKVRYVLLPEANRWQKARLIGLLLRIFWLILRFNPDTIITTGAAHGYFALRIGKWFGAKTIWIDSIANAGEVSKSGMMVKPYADVWLTQWEHLVGAEGPIFQGAVL